MKRAASRVAGRIQPVRRTIFAQAWKTYQRRAGTAWRKGFGIYIHVLRPPYRILVRSYKGLRDILIKFGSYVTAVFRSWVRITLNILGWVANGAGGFWDWIGAEWEDTGTLIRAQLQRRVLTPGDLKVTWKTRRSRLVWLVAKVLGISIAIWCIVKWFNPVANSISKWLAVPLAVVFFFLVLDLSTFLVYIFIAMGVPLIAVVGLVGLVAVAVVLLPYLAVLALLLFVMMVVGAAGLTFLTAGFVVLGVAAATLFIPILIGCIGFALYLIGMILAQLVILLIITILRPGQYLWVLWRSIAYVCPSGDCSSLQVPAHVCPKCDSAYAKLWPSLYGVFHHTCEGSNGQCKYHMPTLDILGRNQLSRVCTNCGMPFRSRSAGKLPAIIVGLVGGTSVGKTTLMLMATGSLIGKGGGGKHNDTKAQIDTPDQRVIFKREWKRLEKGMTVPPTTGSISEAFILRIERQDQEALLYLYDAPGEVYSHVDSFGRLQFLQHAAGIMVLVDPASLGGFRDEAGQLAPEVQASKTSLTDVVNATINTVEKMIERKHEHRLPLPVAVVITKADLEGVKKCVNVDDGRPNNVSCRDALGKWGANPAMKNLENHFETVKYFACSALGRTATGDNLEPFAATGVLEPLFWILDQTGPLARKVDMSNFRKIAPGQRN